MALSAAPWALWLGKDFTLTLLVTVEGVGGSAGTRGASR